VYLVYPLELKFIKSTQCFILKIEGRIRQQAIGLLTLIVEGGLEWLQLAGGEVDAVALTVII